MYVFKCLLAARFSVKREPCHRATDAAAVLRYVRYGAAHSRIMHMHALGSSLCSLRFALLCTVFTPKNALRRRSTRVCACAVRVVGALRSIILSGLPLLLLRSHLQIIYLWYMGDAGCALLAARVMFGERGSHNKSGMRASAARASSRSNAPARRGRLRVRRLPRGDLSEAIVSHNHSRPSHRAEQAGRIRRVPSQSYSHIYIYYSYIVYSLLALCVLVISAHEFAG